MKKLFYQNSISKLMKNNRSVAKAIDQIDFPTPSDRRLFVNVIHALAVLAPVLDNESIKNFTADILAIIFGYHLGIDSSFSWTQWQILTSCFLEDPQLKQRELTYIYNELVRKNFFQFLSASQATHPERASEVGEATLVEKSEILSLQENPLLSTGEAKDPNHYPKPEASSGANAFFSATSSKSIHSFGNLFRQAIDFSKSGQYLEAISLCEEELIPCCQEQATSKMSQDVNLRSVYLVLGEAYFKLDLFEQALKNFESAKKYDSAIVDNGGTTVRRCQEGINKCIEAESAQNSQVVIFHWN
jgi:tetratricopeptide (TPR) repeat protein